MDPDHAYMLGILVAGGRIGKDRISVKFPFKRWGKISSDPNRAANIMKSIVNHIQPKMRQLYNLNAYPVVAPEWQMICDGKSAQLEKELSKYRIRPSGVLREHASIQKMVSGMDSLCKREFVAAMADVIGSVEPSHRRFDMKHTIVSFEILGRNFNLVMELCHVLRDLGCPVDQILWEHPNMHCGYDPWDSEWIKKGNKLRVLTWDYILNASFAFGSKVATAETNIEIERKIEGRKRSLRLRNELCPNRRYQFKYLKTIHKDEFHQRLRAIDPRTLGHFIHYTHICAALGCPYAPKRKIREKFKMVRQGKLINPFVVYKFGTYTEIMQIVKSESIMAQRKYVVKKVSASKIASEYDNSLLFKFGQKVGYRAGFVKDSLNQIVKANLRIPRRKKLNGVGERTKILKLAIRKYKKILDKVSFRVPDLPTPLIVTDKTWAVLIGPENSSAYRRLVQEIDFSTYRGVVLRPIKEEDLWPYAKLV